MVRFVLRRLLAMVVIVFFSSIVVFSLSRMSGDPRYLYISEYTTKELWDAWGKDMGLDKPFPLQYLIWASKAIRLDFGQSLRDQISALKVVQKRVLPTLQLAAGAFTFAILVGIPLGVLAAVTRGAGWDLIGRSFALLGQAMPGFWLGIMLILIFSVELDLLPTSGRGTWKHHVLPSVTLGWFPAAGFLRLVRSSMLEVLDSEYIKFARAKGVSGWKVVWKHAFRNAMVVPITYAGLLLAAFMTGAVVTETVFGWPGLGRLAVQSVFGTDFPVLSTVVLLFTTIYAVMNLGVDIAYAYIDPRIRYA